MSQTGSQLGTVGLLVVFPVLAAVLGAVLAALRRPGRRLTSGVQHFAAGAVIAAIALDVLPGLHMQRHLAIATAGFVVGAAALLGLRQLEAAGGQETHDGPTRRLPIGLLVAVGADLLVDGILVGLSVAILGPAQGVALTIALTLVILPLALPVTVELSDRGASPVKAALIPPLLSLALVVGAVGAVIVLGSAPAALLAAILAFGVAALLFLAAEELLVEAHEMIDTPLLAAMFFAGFFALYVLDASG
ncbi:MAG: ZIP family metal transporter [Actinomycetota bacterium]|nr:ZIP family metal transporter [Actinomycetota bacterium]